MDQPFSGFNRILNKTGQRLIRCPVFDLCGITKLNEQYNVSRKDHSLKPVNTA